MPVTSWTSRRSATPGPDFLPFGLKHYLTEEPESLSQEFTVALGTNWTHVRFVVLNPGEQLSSATSDTGVEPGAEGEGDLMHGIAATLGRLDRADARARPISSILQQFRTDDLYLRTRA